MKKTFALLLLAAGPALAQCPPCPTATPTPTPCPVCSGTPTPTPPAVIPSPTPVPTAPAATPSPTPVTACGLVKYEPNPPGAPRPATLSAGFTTLTLPYQKGPSGPWRLVNLESFGYSTLVPAPPTALFYQDLRFSGIPAAGDGQSYTYGLAATQDGSRVAVGMGGPGDGWGTTVGLPDGGEGFAMRGSFGQDRPMSVGLETVGSRTVAYSWSFGLVQATDVTNLPSDLTQHNLLAEIAPWPGGYLGKVAGTYLTYLNGSGGIIVVNAANLGPVGTITTAMPWTTIGAADFAGRVPQYYTAASFGGVLYILAELRPLAGEQSPSYGILSVTGLAKTASTIWRVPAVPGETWGYGGVSAALVQSGGVVYAIMPAVRSTPTLALVLYAARAASIGTHVGAFTIPQALYAQGFSGFGMVSAAAPPYLYVPTGPGAWAIPLSCVGVP